MIHVHVTRYMSTSSADRIRQNLFKRRAPILNDDYNAGHKRPRRISPDYDGFPQRHQRHLERNCHFPRRDIREAEEEETMAVKGPTSPTPDYISLASKAPQRIALSPVIRPPRKLLILDLNGTLVLRSARPPPSAYREQSQRPLGPGVPLPRNIYPRPYMPAFVEYLFHDETRQWLDTMVWSSAMPASVSGMVEKAFGERTGLLRAVWARDTLGLSDGAYSRVLSLS